MIDIPILMGGGVA